MGIRLLGSFLLCVTLRSAFGAPIEKFPFTPIVECEEEVYRYQPADNGAGPMWCSGSTCLVRCQDQVFVSGLETLGDCRPLNNCRWMLFQRHKDGWHKAFFDETGRTREPCPLVSFPNGELYLSSNPTLVTNRATYGGPARPEILRFDANNLKPPGQLLQPHWAGSPEFSEHSYRSFAADGSAHELILFQNVGYTHAEWAFRDKRGNWNASGKLIWPWGADYEKPEPIRICYPDVALRNRALYFCGVSDVVEPNLKWRAFKKQLTGREWDYDFRRLFFTWCPDITKGRFSEWLEISSREKTCGWISPGDLWVAPDGSAHLLWTERALDERLREKFFPGAKQSHSLNYAVVKDGRVVSRRTLVLAEEGGASEIPGNARFYITPKNQLMVVYYVSGKDSAGKSLAENRLMLIGKNGTPGSVVRLPLVRPFPSFFTPTPRAGCQPSRYLDFLGPAHGTENTISYARIRLS